MKVKELTLCAMMLGIIVVLGMVPSIPLPGAAPLIVQNTGIILAGLVLGGKRAFVVVSVFLVAIAVGLPFLSGGHGGAGVFVGPTAGYVLAYPFAAALLGWVRQWSDKRCASSLPWVVSSVLIFGILMVLLAGAYGTSMYAKTSIWPFLWKQVIYLPGDIIKGVTALVVYYALRPMLSRMVVR